MRLRGASLSLVVEAVYGHASIQGAPKLGLRAFGVPPGGVWDISAYKALNSSLDNQPDAAVLELAHCRLTLVAREEVILAWEGATVAAYLNGAPCQAFQMTMSAGDQLELVPPRVGARAWFGIGGGFVGYNDAALKRGDLLRRGSVSGSVSTHAKGPALEDASVLRAIPGRVEFTNLFENVYRARYDSNRVGIRFDGPKMSHQLELPSEPATPGVIQITPEGLPIILGPDGPTIGGYPRAGVVVTADLPKLAQIRPGDLIRFSSVSLATARELIR